MRRGDIVIVAATGDYGKPRPAVIVQTDAFPAHHALVVVCQMASEIVEAPDFRVTIEPTAENGLRVRSQVMAECIGGLNMEELARVNVALAFVMGLAE